MHLPVLVYGWYGHGNVGDEMFQDAFRQIMPDRDLKFVDKITKKDLEGKGAVIFGGGSFLYKDPWVDPAAMEQLKKLPKAYVGVGVESEVSAVHQEFMRSSSCVAVRTQRAVERLKEFDVEAISIPDIVHLIEPASSFRKVEKTILFVPNVETISRWDSPSWAHLAWEKFKNETAQFFDERLQMGWKISFLSMCKNSQMDDMWAATEIISKMSRRSTRFESVQANQLSVDAVVEEFSTHSVVMSQRYHGIVLAEISQVPCVSIHHHDKLKYVEPFQGEKVPYYEVSKRLMHESVDRVENRNIARHQLDFSNLLDRFENFLKEVDRGQIRRDS